MSEVAWFAPGRIEVLGKHTDYAGGNTLVCAIDRGITVRVRQSPEPGVLARSDASPDALQIIPGKPAEFAPGHWGRYVATAANRLFENFGELADVQLEITSTLPLASGMSSSSALIVAVSLALIDFNGFRSLPQWEANIKSKLDLACYLAAIERGDSYRGLPGNRGVGTLSGSEDHLAMICSAPNELTMLNFNPPALVESVTFPAGYAFVILVSGVLAEKTGKALEAYNRVSGSTQELVASWGRATGASLPNLASVLDSAPNAAPKLMELAEEMGDYYVARLRHFLAESYVIVPEAVEVLANGSLDYFGKLVGVSQNRAELLLGNQIPETSFLATEAYRMGAVAASAFGAGFGGSVWALVPSEDAEGFGAGWLASYLHKFPQHAEAASFLTTRPSAPARRLA